jgi:transposase
MHRLQELVRLHRLGTTARETARLLKMSRKTEQAYREALTNAGLLDGDPQAIPDLEILKAAVLAHHPPKPAPQETSTIEAWADQIAGMAGKGAGPKAIYDRLKLEHDGFTGSYWAVKRLCRRLQEAAGVQPEDVAIPVETAPGEIAQVDFGYLGKLYDPETRTHRKAWVFVMVLGFSRHLFARIVFDQRTETWLQLHIAAFTALGGVVGTVVPDNLKAAVIQAAFGAEGGAALNRSYRELARHFGFKIDPTPAYSPQKKGKVESAVKYVAQNFWRPRQFQDVNEANAELERWTRHVAGTRHHGQTGKRPLEQFEALERTRLRPLPAASFELVAWHEAKVHRDSHVAFDKRLYSVPWRLLGQSVWIKATDTTVAIYHDDERVATHARGGPGYRTTVEGHLPEHRAPLRHRGRAHWEERAAALGPEVADYVRDVFDSDPVLCQLGAVASIIQQLEAVPAERAQAACRRARHFGNYSSRGIRSILRKGLDEQPLPGSAVSGAVWAPRFARKPSEFLTHLKEASS